MYYGLARKNLGVLLNEKVALVFDLFVLAWLMLLKEEVDFKTNLFLIYNFIIASQNVSF